MSDTITDALRAMPSPPRRNGGGGGSGGGSGSGGPGSPTTPGSPVDAPSSSSPQSPSAPEAHSSYGDDSETRSRRLSRPANDDEMATVRNCLQLFYKARQHRRPLVSQWNKNYRVVNNRTWLASRPGWLPSPEVPEIYPILASQVGWMTDQRPTLDVSPFSEPHSTYHEFYSTIAHDLQVVLQANLKVNAFEGQAEQAIWDGFLFGTGIFKTSWDTSLAGGLGDAFVGRVDPYTFYPDPAATSELDANYFIEARTMSIQEADRRFPGCIEHLKSGMIQDTDKAPNMLGAEGNTPKASPGAIAPATSQSFGRPGQSRVHATDDPGITLLECWLRDHTYITLPNSEVESVKEEWRVVVIAGDRVLMDEMASDLWGHESHPYDTFRPHANGQFWGFSIVEWLIPSQLSINRLLAAFIHNVELTGNPVFMEASNSGLVRTQITNKPGSRLTTQQGKSDQNNWLQPPNIAPQMFQLIQFFVEEMERISGLSAIARGMAPGGRNAASVVDQIQESSFVRIRMALRNFERALQSAGNKAATLVAENYTQPRVVQIVGPQAEKSSLAIRGYHFYTPTPEGRLPLRFNLNIEAGSTLATSRQARIAEADALYAMGAIDDLALLEAHNYPNRGAIAKRVGEAKAAGLMEPPGARQRSGRSS